MNIFNEGEELHELQSAWNRLEPDALFMTQYELAEESGYSAETWSIFLRDGKVRKYIDTESQLFAQAQQRKLVQNATTNEKSVGAAQMINAINKLNETDESEPNTYIYCYVPLTENETKAPNVTIDPRWKAPDNIHEVDKPELNLAKVTTKDVVKPKETKRKEISKDDFNW